MLDDLGQFDWAEGLLCFITVFANGSCSFLYGMMVCCQSERTSAIAKDSQVYY